MGRRRQVEMWGETAHGHDLPAVPAVLEAGGLGAEPPVQSSCEAGVSNTPLITGRVGSGGLHDPSVTQPGQLEQRRLSKRCDELRQEAVAELVSLAYVSSGPGAARARAALAGAKAASVGSRRRPWCAVAAWLILEEPEGAHSVHDHRVLGLRAAAAWLRAARQECEAEALERAVGL